MKKVLSLAVSVAVIVMTWGTLAHASSPVKNKHLQHCSAKGTVTFMFWGDKGEDIEQMADIKLAEKACPGLHVNPIWDQGNYDTDLATKIGSGNAPDVFQLDAAKRLPEFVTEGALTDLTPYVKHDHLNLKKIFWVPCLKEAYYQGKVWGLERDCGNQGVLLYNKDMFDARHVAYPTNKWTYKDLLSAAVKLSGNYSLPSDPTSRLRFGISLNTDDYRINQYIWDWGGDWLSKDLKTCQLTSKPAQEALQWWYNLAYKYHGAPTTAQAATAGDYVSGFKDQHYAMTFVGPWALNYIVKPSPYLNTKPVPFHWGVVLNPGGPKSRVALVDTALEVMYSHSHNKTAAWWLIKFLTMGKGGALEGKFGIGLPGDRSVAESSSIKNEYAPYFNVWIQALSPKFGRAMRTIPKYDQWWDTVSTDLKPFWDGSETVQQATSKACSDGSKLLP
jgi:multiple sugar transport system substrate-binding protein